MAIHKVENISSNGAMVRLSSLKNATHYRGIEIKAGMTVDLSTVFDAQQIETAQQEILDCITSGWLKEAS